jgi:hypothetical protein
LPWVATRVGLDTGIWGLSGGVPPQHTPLILMVHLDGRAGINHPAQAACLHDLVSLDTGRIAGEGAL